MATTNFGTMTADPRFIGWYIGPSGNVAVPCQESSDYYVESGSYFGCANIRTGCSLGATGISDKRFITACNSGYSCVTRALHSTYPPPLSDPDRKEQYLCGQNFSRLTLYRTLPTTAASSTPTPSSLPGSTPSDPQSAPTAQSTPIGPPTQTAPAENNSPTNGSQTTSPGVIAGAVIGGVALLAVIAFMVWFFGFYRRKAAKPEVQQQPQSWQPQYSSGFEAPSTAPSQYANQHYSPVLQDVRGSWAHQNKYEMGELSAGEQVRGK